MLGCRRLVKHHQVRRHVPPRLGFFLLYPQVFAKARDSGVDLQNLDLMKVLVSQMPRLKLRLLDRIVQARNNTHGVDVLSNQRLVPNKMTICKAVEDRICKRIDLASRTDLTDCQVMEALRLILKIVRRSDLPVDFSPEEIFLLTHGVPKRSRIGMTAQHERATIRF